MILDYVRLGEIFSYLNHILSKLDILCGCFHLFQLLTTERLILLFKGRGGPISSTYNALSLWDTKHAGPFQTLINLT